MRTSPTNPPPPKPDLDPVDWYAERDPVTRRALLRREKTRRAYLLAFCRRDLEYRDAFLERCRRDLPFWCDQVIWTYDPRERNLGGGHLPMVLWPVQRRYIAFVLERIELEQDFLCEKSRDMGVTYLNCVIALHRWLFEPGFKTSICANKLALVDEKGNQDAVFTKVRMMIDRLPGWMRPAGYVTSVHALIGRIINPANENTIIGEGGADAGRGGRATLYLIDEAAHVDDAESVNAATSGTANIRGWCSSVNGVGNFFWRMRHAGTTKVITLHWRDHPRKDDAWAAAEKERVTPETFAQESDIDYAKSKEGLVVQKAWVDAAVELWRMLPHPAHGDRAAGLDVGAGKDLSVFQPRIGELVPKAESRREGDTTETALWALELCKRDGIARLMYDPVGVGEGVKSTLNINVHQGLAVHPTNWGLPASASRIWPDGRTSRETFDNLKAELWWIMRERFRRSYLLWLHLTGQPGGQEIHQSDCFLLEPSPELQAELVMVTWHRTGKGNKIEIERKEQLARRGIKSPDHADALCYSLEEPVTVNMAEHLILGPQLEASTMRW